MGGFKAEPGQDNPMYEQNIQGLNTSTNIRASFTLASFLQAKADPSFQIDPAFPYADYFELEFSPGFDEVEPVPDPVPEPASVTMFAVGLVTLIARRMRCRHPIDWSR